MATTKVAQNHFYQRYINAKSCAVRLVLDSFRIVFSSIFGNHADKLEHCQKILIVTLTPILGPI
jgi:hypothetical protein